MKCLISKSQIRLLFCLVWWSIVFLYALRQFYSGTPRKPGTFIFNILKFFLLSLFFLLSDILLILYQPLAAIFHIHLVSHPLPLKREERMRKKPHPLIYYQLKNKDFINIKPILIIASFGKLIFKICQRQKTISTKSFVNYCNLIMLLVHVYKDVIGGLT